MVFELPKLEYPFNSLEPYIDEKTMLIHHDKHHQTYINKLNSALEKYSKLKDKSAEEFVKNPESIPEEIKIAVRNNAGGHLNHSFFWKILKKNIAIKKKMLDAINKKFGSFDNFKKEFSNSAMNVFGSGWTWLVIDKGELKILNTSGHDNPIHDGKIPILVIDMWEHAYYLKYQNRKDEYISAFFNVINWDEVEENFLDIDGD